MTIYHNHHIIPVHVGGSDDPSNRIMLTIPEHAEAHRLLFEKYGRREDWIAWQGLSGQIGMDEIIKERHRVGALKQRGRKRTPQQIAKHAAALRGRPLSDDHKAKIGVAHKGRIKSADHIAKQAASLRDKPRSVATKAKISISLLRYYSQKKQHLDKTD